jgi:hypothetical protein
VNDIAEDDSKWTEMVQRYGLSPEAMDKARILGLDPAKLEEDYRKQSDEFLTLDDYIGFLFMKQFET